MVFRIKYFIGKENEVELGNAVFGCSRGDFEIPDREAWEKELFRLFDVIDPDHYCHELEFENDTFKLTPYYWGDCTCDYDNREHEWLINNRHEYGCYYYDYQKVKNHFPSVLDRNRYLNEVIKPIYIKHGFDTTGKDWWHGFSIRCDCGRDERFEKWSAENYHSGDCLLVKPNFLHKPTGFEIKWYKYPLRDSYMNQDITIEQFAKIIDDCIKSL